jgi:hypothetical protein
MFDSHLVDQPNGAAFHKPFDAKTRVARIAVSWKSRKTALFGNSPYASNS